MPFPIAPVIGSLATFGSNLIKRAYAKKDLREQRKYRRQESEYAYGKNLEQWNRQNVYNKEIWDMQNTYNLPKNQMDRFKNAGLNPNLIYGQTNQADSIGKSDLSPYQAPRTDFNPPAPDMGNVIGQFQDIKMKNAQIDLVNEQRQNQTLQRHYMAGKLYTTDKKAYKYGLGKTPDTYFSDSLAGQKYLGELNRFNLQSKGIESTNIMRALEAKWWQSIQGVKGATGIAQIIKMFGGNR